MLLSFSFVVYVLFVAAVLVRHPYVALPRTLPVLSAF